MRFRVSVQGLCSCAALLGVSLAAACGSDTPPSNSSAGGVAPAPVSNAGTSAAGNKAPAANSGGSTATNNTGGTTGGSTAPVMTAGSVAVAPTAGTSGGGAGSESPPTNATSDWTSMGYDLASTYFNRGETKLTKANAAMLAEAWTVDMGGNVYGAPLQIGDKIYASGPTSVRAFNAADGMMLWTSAVGSTGSLAYADGTLYLNNTSGIVAISAADGNRLWSKPLGSGSDGTASPLVVGDVIVAGASNGAAELTTGNFRGFMAAVDRMTGAAKWATYTVPESAHGASMWSSPAADLAAGRVYGSTGNNYGAPATDTSDAFIAFDLASGDIIWKSQRVMNDTFGGGSGLGGGPDADFGANPVLYETMIGGVMTKVIAAGNKGGEAHAVRAEDGMMLWERDLGPGAADGSSGIFTNSAWTGKYMLFACNEGTTATLFALDGATGEMAWMRALPGLVWGRTAVANGVGFIGAGTKLEVFDVDTGDVLKSFDSKGGTVAGTITVSNGRVAFGEGLSWSSGKRGTTLHVLALP